LKSAEKKREAKEKKLADSNANIKTKPNRYSKNLTLKKGGFSENVAGIRNDKGKLNIIETFKN